MKKVSVLLASALLVAGLLTGCGGGGATSTSGSASTSANASGSTSTTAATPNIDAIKKAGKIVMVTNAQFPPFESMDDAGAVVGVDVDVANEIATDLGVSLEITDMDFDLLIEAVKSNKADFAAAGMTITDERKEEVDFSDEYVTSSQYVVVKKGSTIKADNLNDLTIACQEGTTGDFFASGDADYGSDIKAKEVLRFKSGIEAGSAVASGKADAMILDEMPAKAIAESRSDELEVLPDALTTESYAIAVAKEKPDLLEAINKTLQRLKDEGKIDEYITAHMTEE